jgi:SRSO17 transposase
VLAEVRKMVVPAIERHGPIEAWIIDDTSYPKQGKHSCIISIAGSLASRPIVRWW